MTTSEFSNEFDVLYNNIMSNQAPGLDEYEKSVFLTKAQSEILKNYFNPKGNKYGQGFDESSKRQMDFSTIIETVSPTIYTPTPGSVVTFTTSSILYSLPLSMMLILNESGILSDKGTSTITNPRLINIVPLNYLEYGRLMSKPYKQPLKNQAWRLLQKQQNKLNIAEIIYNPTFKFSDYKIRFVRKPCPIIVADLSGDYSDTSLDGIKIRTECELDTIIHPEILQRAVELAKAAYIGDVNSEVELGKRSE